MPLLEQYYIGPPDTPTYLFAPAAIDDTNNAIIQIAGDVVTVRGVIVAQSIIPLYDAGGNETGLGFAGASLELKYRPAGRVKEVGRNTVKPILGAGAIPDPPWVATEPGEGAPMGVFIEPDGAIQIGSLGTSAEDPLGFFSAFYEPCSVFFQYIAAHPEPEVTVPVPGTAAGAPGPFGVRKVSR